MVDRVRFELTTSALSAQRSNQLSYPSQMAPHLYASLRGPWRTKGRHNPSMQRTTPGVPALNAIGGGPLYTINVGDHTLIVRRCIRPRVLGTLSLSIVSVGCLSLRGHLAPQLDIFTPMPRILKVDQSRRFPTVPRSIQSVISHFSLQTGMTQKRLYLTA